MPNGKNYISKVQLSDGTYFIKDTEAHEKLAGLTGAMHFVGISSTDPTSAGGPTVAGHTGDFAAGDVVVYTPGEKQEEREYVYNGSWQEFGSTGSLKALAFKDSASGNVDVSGTAEPQVFTGNQEILVHDVTGSSVRVEGNYDKPNDISIDYTPEGTISAPVITLSTGTAIASVTDGSVNAGSAASLSYTNSTIKGVSTVTSGSKATLTYSPVKSSYVESFSKGTLPSITQSDAKASYISAFDGGSVATLTKKDVKATYIDSLTPGSAASFEQGAKASWLASVSDETLSFTFTPNGDDTFKPNTPTAITKSDITATAISAFNGGSVAKLTRTDVDATKIDSFSQGTLPVLSVSEKNSSIISSFDGGKPTVVSTSDVVVSTISKFTANTPTEVTLPEFTPGTFATGVASVSAPAFTGKQATLSYALGFTSQSITSTGTASITIANHVFTPSGKNAASNVSANGSVTVE